MNEVNIRRFVRQRGASLIYALVAVAALAMAAVALVRSVSTSSLVAGNLAFKQEAAAAADQAVRQAVADLDTKLTATSSGLDNNIAASGYYATSDDLIDVTGSQLSSATRKLVNWGDNCSTQSAAYASCAYTPKAVAAINGNAAKYVVFRLCNQTGDQAAANCARPLTATAATNLRGQGSPTYRDPNESGTESNSPYYRIVVRVAGARNTTSYTETIIHF